MAATGQRRITHAETLKAPGHPLRKLSFARAPYHPGKFVVLRLPLRR
ncbi:hypothetical protein ACIBHX_18185 [Nonomuraea sp. NPDC050536]